jgi:hypothetical protein
MIQNPGPSRPTSIYVTLAMAFVFVGCSGSVDDAGGGTDASADAASLGNISAQFRLPSGSASTASYTLTGPNFNQAATLDFMGSQAIGFLINGVPPGTYQIAFTATDADGGESCMGSTTIVVQPGKTATANLEASCVGGPYVPSGYGLVDTWVTLPRGVSLTAATCTLTGPAGLEVPDFALTPMGSSDLHFGLKMVPAGPGQVLVINGTASDGTNCENSIAVDVVANQTAEAMLTLVCR